MSGWGDARLRETQSSLLPLTTAVALLVLTGAGLSVGPPRRLQVIDPGPAILDHELNSEGVDMVSRQADARVR